MSELKAYLCIQAREIENKTFNCYNQTLAVKNAPEATMAQVYLKSEADKVIAEKYEEIYNIKYSRDEWAKACNQKDTEIAELKQKLEDVNELIKTARQMLEDAKATHYAEMVDAGSSPASRDTNHRR